MNLRVTALILSVFLFGVFGALSLSFMKTTDLLNFEAQELTKSGESIRLAQGLKVRLLSHNRNSFLYSLHRNPSHHETRQTQRREIKEILTSAESYLNGQDEQAILAEVNQEIADYLEKRDHLEAKPITPQRRYNLVSREVEKAISAIDKLVAINRSQMSNLVSEINRKNEAAHKLAVFLFCAGGLILLGIVVAAFKFVAHPLISLSSLMVRYGKGETSVRAARKGSAEIREVSSSFNSMAQSLEEKRQDQLRFIATIAHDLRNPLNSMSMASELLIRRSHEEDKELSKIIFRQVKNLDRLVGDLLDITRIEAGQLDLNLSDQEIRSLVKDSVELHRTGSDLHAFKVELPNDALNCKCDGRRLSQVINNLLSNAVKYSPNGGTVTVRAWREGSEVKISVADQGIGIEPENLENIFKPFHRTDKTKNMIPGVGLGLSASRRIVEAHGGKLRVESVLGKGSVFYVSLPHKDVMQQTSHHGGRSPEGGVSLESLCDPKRLPTLRYPLI